MNQTRINPRFVGMLLILPMALLAIGILYVHHTGLFFLRSVDPEYAYLFNGLILAQLHPDIQYTDHPGIPVQCLVAIVSRGVHLFRPGQSLVNDVLQYPELYIRATLYSANVINAIAVFLLGYYTYRYSRNLVVAAFLQLSPFAHVITLEVLGRIMPELIMNGIVCCWLIVLVKLIYQDNDVQNFKRYSLVFALLFGLSLADKLTFLPYFLLPLIVLPSWKFRLRYMVLSLFSFLLFAFPVVLNYKAFFRWITNIFIHTGAYGGGGKGILNGNEFFNHVEVLIGNTRILMSSLIILLIVTFFYLIKQRKHYLITDFNARIILAVVVLSLIQYLMAAKHFALHYMIPTLLLTIFNIFMISVLLNRLLPTLLRIKVTNIMLGIAGLLMLTSITPKIAGQLKQMQEATAVKTDSYNRLSFLLKASPKIVCPSYYGCSAVEYALTFGLHLSGKHGNFLYEKMEKLYPSTYMYFPWGKVFYKGNKEISPSSFLRPSTAYTLYISDYSEEKLNEILAALRSNGIEGNYNVRNLFHSSVTAESLFLLKINNINHADSLVNASH